MKWTEKNASPVGSMLCDGVELVSRYKVPSEYGEMAKAVARVGANRLSRIFCDSKATHCYTIRVKSWGGNLQRAIVLAQLDHAFDGHNGIVVEEPNGQTTHIDPRWPGDDLERANA